MILNVSGGLQPISLRRDTSIVSRSITDLAGRVAQHRRRHEIDARVVVDDPLLVRRQLRVVRRVARIEQREAGPVEIHAIEVRVVRALTRLAADRREVHDPLHRIDVDEPLGAPRAGGQRALEMAGVVVEVECPQPVRSDHQIMSPPFFT